MKFIGILLIIVSLVLLAGGIYAIVQTGQTGQEKISFESVTDALDNVIGSDSGSRDIGEQVADFLVANRIMIIIFGAIVLLMGILFLKLAAR